MEAKELRIGNKAIETSTNYKGITEKEITVSIKDLMNAESLNAIELTEEWLLRFGFEVEDTVILKYSLGWIYLNNDFQPIDSELSEICSYKIEYVHQLQNLYFALTGEELELK